VSDVDFTALAELDDLDLDQINDIMAGGREKGIYKEALLDFINSGKLGKPHKFSGKKAASVKTGFETAKEAVEKDGDLDDDVKAAAKNTVIRVRGDGVFLVRNDLVKAAKAAQSS